MTLFDFQTSESHLAGETVRYRRWSQTTFKVDPVRHQGVCDPASRWIPSVIKVDAIHLQGRSRSTSMRSRTTLKVDPVPHECGREPPSRWIPFHHQGGCDPPSRWIPSVIKVDAIHLQGRSRSTSMRSRTTLKVDPVPHECGREQP